MTVNLLRSTENLPCIRIVLFRCQTNELIIMKIRNHGFNIYNISYLITQFEAVKMHDIFCDIIIPSKAPVIFLHLYSIARI